MALDAAKLIGERLHAARVAKGHTLRSLAALGGFDFNSLSRIERGGHNITLQTLLRLSHYLDVPASEILKGIKGIPSPSRESNP